MTRTLQTISSCRAQIVRRCKTRDIIAKNTAAIGLNIRIKKNKTMKINSDTDNIKLEGEALGMSMILLLPW